MHSQDKSCKQNLATIKLASFFQKKSSSSAFRVGSPGKFWEGAYFPSFQKRSEQNFHGSGIFFVVEAPLFFLPSRWCRSSWLMTGFCLNVKILGVFGEIITNTGYPCTNTKLQLVRSLLSVLKHYFEVRTIIIFFCFCLLFLLSPFRFFFSFFIC